MEGETYISNPEWQDTDSTVGLVEERYENGFVSYKIEMNPQFVQECFIHDQA